MEAVRASETLVSYYGRHKPEDGDLKLMCRMASNSSPYIVKVRQLGVANVYVYEGVSKSFRTGRLERELQTVQLSATRCSCIAIL
jgi:hypothetical protein